MYPLTGYYLAEKADYAKCRRWLPLIWMIAIVGLCVSCYMTYAKGITKDEGIFKESLSQTYFKLFCLIHTIAMFLSFKCLFSNPDGSNPAGLISLSRWISLAGSCTFGVYLVHVLVINRFYTDTFRLLLIDLGCDQMIAAFAFTLMIMVISFGLSWILKQIPGIKKIL